MAILPPMTQEEYEKKYGVKPFESSTLPKEEKRSIVQKIGGFLGVEKFAQGIGQAAFGLTKEKKDLDKMLAEGKVSPEEYERITTGGLSDREVVGSAINTATLFAPGAARGASMARKVVAGAATGYGLDVGSKLQNKDIPTESTLSPGIGTVVGATLPLIGAVVGKVSPKRLEEINLRMTPTEKQLMAKQGKDIPKFLAEKKIVGTPEVRYTKVKKMYDSLETKVNNLIEDSGVKFSKNSVLERVRAIPEQFSDDIAGYDEATRTTNKVLEFLQSKSPIEVDGKLLNTYKRGLFDRAYSRNNTDVVNETYHAVASVFKDMLDEAVPTLKKVNQEYGNVILARKILFKAMSRPQIGLVGKSLGAAAGAGVGATMGGGLGFGLGAIAGEKTAEHFLGTATRSTVGAGIQTLMDKIPSDKMGNLQVTKKALIRLLQGVFGQ